MHSPPLFHPYSLALRMTQPLWLFSAMDWCSCHFFLVSSVLEISRIAARRMWSPLYSAEGYVWRFFTTFLYLCPWLRKLDYDHSPLSEIWRSYEGIWNKYEEIWKKYEEIWRKYEEIQRKYEGIWRKYGRNMRIYEEWENMKVIWRSMFRTIYPEPIRSQHFSEPSL